MLRFACPRCRAVMEAPDNRGGSKIACLKCKQKLQVPLPPRNKTVLSPRVGHTPEGVKKASWRLPGVSRRAAIYAAAGLGVALLLTLLLLLWPRSSVGTVAEVRGDARIPEEELVRKFILNNSKDASAVKFLKWGPHLLTPEIRQIARQAGISEEMAFSVPGSAKGTPLSLIRVCYHDPHEDGQIYAGGSKILADEKQQMVAVNQDRVFMVSGGRVLPWIDNTKGDGWKTELRRGLAQRFPGITP